MAVPQDWTDAMTQLREAQTVGPAMRSATATQQQRDEATVRYVRAVDALVACLDRLSEQQVLGRITMLLSRKDRT